MKTRFSIITIFSILIVSACNSNFIVCSLYPFYIPQNIVNNDHIEGLWKAEIFDESELPAEIIDNSSTFYNYYWGVMDTLCKWSIKRFAYETKYGTHSGKDSIGYLPGNYYVVQLIGNNSYTALYKFKLVLFRVKGELYGDFTPFETDGLKNSLLANSLYLKVHTLAKIDLKGKKMRISFLSNDTMQALIGLKHARIKHRLIGETNRLTLTATSNELTTMIEKYGKSPRFINWDRQSTMLKLIAE